MFQTVMKYKSANIALINQIRSIAGVQEIDLNDYCCIFKGEINEIWNVSIFGGVKDDNSRLIKAGTNYFTKFNLN